MADVFISYTRADSDRAGQVARALESCGHSVFYDVDLVSGDSWDQRIERELAAAAAVIVLWSAASRDRQWVRNEARSAMARGILFPALVGSCEIPVEFSHLQAPDLRQGTLQAGHQGWDALLRGIANPLRAGISPSPETVEKPNRGKSIWLRGGAAVAAVILLASIAMMFVKKPVPVEPSPTAQHPPIATPSVKVPGREAQTASTEIPATPEQTEEADVKRDAESAEQHTTEQAATKPAVRKPAAKPKPYDLNLLHPDIRAAAESARAAEARAEAIAVKALDAEKQALLARERAIEKATGTIVYMNPKSGWTYQGEGRTEEPKPEVKPEDQILFTANGYGVFAYRSYDMSENTQHYAGEVKDGHLTGFGVHYGGEGLGKQEGEFVDSIEKGGWVAVSRERRDPFVPINWASYAGDVPDSNHAVFFGVYRFNDGSRYEGEWRDNVKSGHGVKWSADGSVSETGIWEDNSFTTKLAN